jgi:hypothetical protein
MLLGQLADAPKDQMRLYRRSARRIDDKGNRGALTDREGAIERTGKAGKRESRAQRGGKADDAGQSHHRHNRTIALKTLRDEVA